MFIRAFYTPFICYPGGIGVSKKNVDRWDELFRPAAEHIAACRCASVHKRQAGIGVGSLLQELAGGERHVL